MTENEARPADVNLARIASALERLATVAERSVGLDDRSRGHTYAPTVPYAASPAAEPPPQPAPEPRREFQFSASAGARLREGDKHDAEHKAVKRGRSGGLYCPTQLGDGSWCNWRQAA